MGAGEFNPQPLTSGNDHQSSTHDLRKRRLVEEYSHADLNTLLQTKNNQDRRSILKDEYTVAIHFYRKKVGIRFGKSVITDLPNRIPKIFSVITDLPNRIPTYFLIFYIRIVTYFNC